MSQCTENRPHVLRELLVKAEARVAELEGILEDRQRTLVTLSARASRVAELERALAKAPCRLATDTSECTEGDPCWTHEALSDWPGPTASASAEPVLETADVRCAKPLPDGTGCREPLGHAGACPSEAELFGPKPCLSGDACEHKIFREEERRVDALHAAAQRTTEPVTLADRIVALVADNMPLPVEARVREQIAVLLAGERTDYALPPHPPEDHAALIAYAKTHDEDLATIRNLRANIRDLQAQLTSVARSETALHNTCQTVIDEGVEIVASLKAECAVLHQAVDVARNVSRYAIVSNDKSKCMVATKWLLLLDEALRLVGPNEPIESATETGSVEK